MKTPEQKRILRDNRMIPLLWYVAVDSKDHLTVVNRVTGEWRVLDK